ncbi:MULTISPECIES: hypothetical protein [unclassified Streptomyces]|uniref:hypothetical protein n=1 Tax=unclassified Streptomyces TaxID=2593676 RepID=UPI00136BE888|nr:MULTISPECIES: hypothetical protein [unclassified Streptomyces]MYS20470.1 hypothetical protein [Streptomyces sp. SID4948]
MEAVDVGRAETGQPEFAERPFPQDAEIELLGVPGGGGLNVSLPDRIGAMARALGRV